VPEACGWQAARRRVWPPEPRAGWVPRSCWGRCDGPLAAVDGDLDDVVVALAYWHRQVGGREPGPDVATAQSGPNCRDQLGLEYSPGALAVMGGVTKRCGPGGEWRAP
jgi:hypothetical protein